MSLELLAVREKTLSLLRQRLVLYEAFPDVVEHLCLSYRRQVRELTRLDQPLKAYEHLVWIDEFEKNYQGKVKK